MGIPCFVSGTRVETPTGPRLIEDLKAGDDVVSGSTGAARAILWAGQRRVSPSAMRRNPSLQPVLLPRHVLGNHSDLLLSRSHAVALGLPGDARLFRAGQLLHAVPGVRPVASETSVTYHHLYLASHDLIVANGLLCETFLPGPRAIATLGSRSRKRLLDVLEQGPHLPILPYAQGNHVRALKRMLAQTKRPSQNQTVKIASAVAISTLAAAIRMPTPNIDANR
ncbi:MAG: Hint domain-containing protein [Deltaproteobacteria bacterium]